MTHRDRPIRVRLGACLVVFMILFVALALRVWQLQLISDRRVVQLQKRQDDHEVTLSSQRGSILDARGRELAVSLWVPSIYADPSETGLSRKDRRNLGNLLHVSPDRIAAKLKDRNKYFVWLKRQVDPAIGKKVEKLNLPGIGVTNEWARLYPGRELAAQVVGVVGTDGDGLEGIERFYDHFLRARPLTIRAERDRKGRSIFTQEEAWREPERGASLYLTIDTTIQNLTEKELFEAARTSGSKEAMAVVLDPNDGRVVAMASYPPVNPNRLDRANPSEWRNRPVEEVFEPGSTFKIFTLAAALEAGTLNPTQGINCQKGSLVISGKVIHNTHDHPWLDPRGILKYSNNIGAARIGLALGRDRLSRTINDFGFGEKTGIDSPAEERGLLLKPAQWREMETATVSFGQGIGVTAIQLVTAMASIANGGFSIHPRIVDRAVLSDGTEAPFERKFQPARVLRPETVRFLREWMESVTEKDGTGASAAMADYTVAGKTGTAQMLDPATGKYSNRLVTSSFMGFAPTTHPKLAAIFVFRAPRHADYGGTLAGPVFRRVISASLAYFGAAPDKPFEKSARLVLEAKEEKPEKVIRSSVGGTPDFLGLTMREAIARASELSLNLNIVGTGVAIRQGPLRTPPGQKQASIRVFFSRTAGKERS
ncbi:MAG: penicillin-binding transpeptidase domain-containing protein [Pseudomonadota bacterium]